MNCIGGNQNDSMINSLMARSLRRVSFAEEEGLESRLWTSTVWRSLRGITRMARMAATQQTQLSLDFGAHFEPARGHRRAICWTSSWEGTQLRKQQLLSESYLCFLWLKHRNRMQVDSPCPHQQVKPKAEKEFLKFSQMARMWSPTLSLAQTHFHQCPGLAWILGARCQR